MSESLLRNSLSTTQCTVLVIKRAGPMAVKTFSLQHKA